MPNSQTLGEMIKLGDLPIEQKEQIADAIIYNAEHESEFYGSVNHVKLDANKTSMTFVRSYLPEIDKTSERYKNGLVEGITPDAEEINEAEFSVPVVENGWYYKFTNKALNHAWQDIKGRCTKYLSNLFATYHDEKIADAYLSSANIVTGIDLMELKDLLRLHTILYMNGAVDEGGFFTLKVAPEVADSMVVEFKDIITHTSQKEAVIKGYVGEVGGFRIVKSRLQAFQKDASNNYPFIAYGKTKTGEFPVSICAYDNMSSSIIFKPCGSLGNNDALNQRGSIGLYVDGHGFYVYDDSICVTGSVAASTLTLSTATMSHQDAKGRFKFDNAYRSQLERVGGAREIVPAYDYLKLHVYSSGTTANTYTMKIYGGDGAELTASDYTWTSGATGVFTVSSGVITAVAKGIGTLVIEKTANKNIKTIVTVEIIDGTGADPVVD